MKTCKFFHTQIRIFSGSIVCTVIVCPRLVQQLLPSKIFLNEKRNTCIGVVIVHTQIQIYIMYHLKMYAATFIFATFIN